MSNIILTTPDELRTIVSEAISGAFPKPPSNLSQIDTITLTDALDLLKEHGYPTSKAKIYKLTSSGDIPCKTYGNKLVFSRKELLLWAENQTKPKHDASRVSLALARSARRKKITAMKGRVNDCGKYIRIGTTLYKTVQRPLISGDYIEEKIPWSYETLRQDYGKNNLPEIEKYDGFCIIPDHIHYKQVHRTYLNQYEPISHLPSPGDFPKIRSFLTHIFGEQLELGLDYLQILYTRPTQMLPILLLVSNEQNTGKTTFLRFLKMIFGKNATFNTNEDFRSQFNADWANRLLVLVDELLLNKMEDTEKIKNLSTAGDYKIEAKGKDRREIEFFAKFVLCSNNERNPIIIPKEEVRFWVRKINPVEKDNIHLREQMATEIPHFLDFLLHRELSSKNESRMWFHPSTLATPALQKIKNYNTNKIEIEMAAYCYEVMENLKQTKLRCCPKDLMDVLRESGLRADINTIRNILKDSWGLTSEKNGDYFFYLIGTNGELVPVKRKGRYMEIEITVVDKILL